MNALYDKLLSAILEWLPAEDDERRAVRVAEIAETESVPVTVVSAMLRDAKARGLVRVVGIYDADEGRCLGSCYVRVAE